MESRGTAELDGQFGLNFHGIKSFVHLNLCSVTFKLFKGVYVTFEFKEKICQNKYFYAVFFNICHFLNFL